MRHESWRNLMNVAECPPPAARNAASRGIHSGDISAAHTFATPLFGMSRGVLKVGENDVNQDFTPSCSMRLKSAVARPIYITAPCRVARTAVTVLISNTERK
jgi:hypothetical protein